jgi:hypothetical protein
MSSSVPSKRFALHAITVVVSMGCTCALAQEATPDTWMQIASTQSREQVRAEGQQARKAAPGTNVFAEGYVESVPVPRTRLQVRAEVIAARNSGELAVINSEAHDFMTKQAPVWVAAKP